MGFIKGKLLVFGLFASLLGVTANAQETIVPLNESEPIVLFEKSIQSLQQQIEQAKGLDPAERTRRSREIADQAEGMRDRITEVNRLAKILGENVFVAGLIVTYAGEYNFQTPWNLVQAAPGGELGVAVFLRKNEEYVSSSIRGAVVNVYSIAGEIKAGQQAIARRTGIDKGLRVKVLLGTNDGSSASGVTLNDFEGAYTGAGGELSLFGRDLGIVAYTKTFNIGSVYVFAFQGTKGDTQGAAGVVKEIVLDFQLDNNGEGFGF